MPIYAYRCEACGFAKDALQKMSDEPLTACPSCHKESFKKQVTAAGFQLKGSGWYVTDFRGGEKASGTTAASSEASGAAGNTADSTSAATATNTPTTAAAATTSATETAKPAVSTTSSTSAVSSS
ncbi:MAG: zinc ribbon domain-containing protein [Glaciimonas sp.]|nr:zinc ribbon domain-containing protein [Glaciimonas sp.]